MKVEGIVLAAGLSSRVGKNKLLLDIDGYTIIERCILSMYDICSRIIVIGGHDFKNIEKVVDDYSKVELIYNANYKDGMFTSVKKGLTAITADKFFMTPGDYPSVNKDTYRKLLDSKGDIIIPVYKNKNGHPLLMKSHLIEEILLDATLESLRDFLKSKPCNRVSIEDEGILLDVDYMNDYKRIKAAGTVLFA